MKNLYNFNLSIQGVAVITGALISVLLLLSIPLLFKTKIKPIREQPPVIIEMMAINIPPNKVVTPKKPIEKVKTIKSKIVKPLKPKPSKPKLIKPKQIDKPIKAKIPKKTLLAKVRPEPQLIEKPLPKVVKETTEKRIQKVIEKPIQNNSAKRTNIEIPIPVPIFKLTEAPQFLHREDLIYPEIMRSSGSSGVVKLAVLIGKEGNVYRVTILKSAGKAFDDAAKKALLASTFIPAKIGDKVVAVELRMPVKFRLL